MNPKHYQEDDQADGKGSRVVYVARGDPRELVGPVQRRQADLLGRALSKSAKRVHRIVGVTFHKGDQDPRTREDDSAGFHAHNMKQTATARENLDDPDEDRQAVGRRTHRASARRGIREQGGRGFEEPLKMGFEQTRDLLELAIEEKGRDWIYPNFQEGCYYYEDDGSPGCIFGWVFNRLGLELLNTYDNEESIFQLISSNIIVADYKTTVLMGTVQRLQDDGDTWGYWYDGGIDKVKQIKKEPKLADELNLSRFIDIPQNFYKTVPKALKEEQAKQTQPKRLEAAL